MLVIGNRELTKPWFLLLRSLYCEREIDMETCRWNCSISNISARLSCHFECFCKFDLLSLSIFLKYLDYKWLWSHWCNFQYLMDGFKKESLAGLRGCEAGLSALRTSGSSQGLAQSRLSFPLAAEVALGVRGWGTGKKSGRKLQWGAQTLRKFVCVCMWMFQD